MDKHQRIQAALSGRPVDRLPLSLWRHYHCADRDATDLAAVTLDLASTYDLDLIKLTPCGLYAVEDWAGTCIEFPGSEHEPPYLQTPVVTRPAEWRSLPVLEPAAGALSRELGVVRRVLDGTHGQIPTMMTLFSPLTLAYKLAGVAVVEHLRHRPAALHAGLETITQTTTNFAHAALDAGAHGLFFATQLASHDWLEPGEYDRFGRPYDLAVLEAVAHRSTITVLHLHGQRVFFELANRYPVHAVSWHNWETGPTLSEARALTDRAFVAGLDRRRLEDGPPAAIEEQVQQVVAQTNGRGLILAPSCVIPTTTPEAHLQAVRRAVDRLPV
jgi:uroporphyrinogen decarboxylase